MSNRKLPTGLARLHKLANVILPDVPEECFDMRHWQCGTVACAAGWACRDEEFQQQGLHASISGRPVFRGDSQFEALAAFFEISYTDAINLFDYREKVTLEAVRDRINTYISTANSIVEPGLCLEPVYD